MLLSSLNRFLLPCLLLCAGLLQAQECQVKIHGRALNFQGETITYTKYIDRISYTEEKLASCKIRNDGGFDLEFECRTICSGKLIIGFQSTELIVTPCNTYDITIEDSSISLLIKPLNPFIQAKPLKMKVSETGRLSLNRMVDSVQSIIDQTLLDTNKKVTTGIIKERYKKLRLELEPVLMDSLNPYLKNYALYSLAPVDAMVNRFDEVRVWRKYFQNGDIEYDHPVYMQYFNDFYDHYLDRRSQFVSFHDLDYCINRLASYPALMDSMGKDSLLRNERLRELVMIKALSGFYYSSEYSQENITKILNYTRFNSKFAEHRVASENLLNGFKWMTKGELLPDFQLINQNGVIFTKSQYAGIPVYYSFVTTWCEDCISELMVIKKIQQRFGDKVRFVTIVCNGNEAVLAGFLRQHPDWKWDFLLLNKEIEILKKYRIRSFPTFLYAGRSAEVVQFPALSPSNGIEHFIDRWLSEKN